MKVNWESLLGLVATSIGVGFILTLLKVPVVLHYILMFGLGIFWPYPIIEKDE